MKILFTGKGSAGSWQIRGKQLGEAVGGYALSKASIADCQRADVIVAVKRLNHRFSDSIKLSGKPWIWDLVDFYPQPFCTQWSKTQAIKWVQNQTQQHKPDGIIWPNQKMRDDCDIGIPGTVIYHHHRPDIAVNPIRETILKVGYEGEPTFLGEWMDRLLQECRTRQWDFILNPPSITDLDVVFAFRGEHVNGYAQQHWKSNVKLSNAQGSGTPFVGLQECSYIETNTGGAAFVSGPTTLRKTLDGIVSRETRQEMSKLLLEGAYTLERASMDLREFIKTICDTARK